MASTANTPTLKSIVERVNRLSDEKQEIADAIREVYLEAKSAGFEVKAIRRVVRDMRKPPDQSLEDMIDLYKSKLGMLVGTPLGEASIARATAPFHPPPDDEPRVADPS